MLNRIHVPSLELAGCPNSNFRPLSLLFRSRSGPRSSPLFRSLQPSLLAFTFNIFRWSCRLETIRRLPVASSAYSGRLQRLHFYPYGHHHDESGGLACANMHRNLELKLNETKQALFDKTLNVFLTGHTIRHHFSGARFSLSPIRSAFTSPFVCRIPAQTAGSSSITLLHHFQRTFRLSSANSIQICSLQGWLLGLHQSSTPLLNGS